MRRQGLACDGGVVPELTRSADIQLNKRLLLRRHSEMLSQPQIVD
jgi:hypothetical protein